jgi:Lon protease-like protein
MSDAPEQLPAGFDPDPLKSFRGTTRLFPLPSVALFPHVLVPLHIFEPRYRAMLRDAIASDQLLTTVLVKPGHEAEAGAPPLFPVGCLGQIVRCDPLPDGRSNIVLRGICRVRIDVEQQDNRPYRTARVTVLEDHYPVTPQGTAAIRDLGERVLTSLTELLRLAGRTGDAETILAVRDVPAGKLCDIASHCVGFDATVKQALLEEPEVMRRIETLMTWMHAVLTNASVRHRGDEPGPAFSVN